MTISRLTLLSLTTLLSFVSTHIDAQSFGHTPNDTTSRLKSVYNILNNLNARLDSVGLQKKEEILKQLEDVDFVSGAIYFSGANFANVTTTSLKGKGAALALKVFIDRCIVGSRISFEKCNIMNTDGTKSVLHKSIVFQ